MAEKIGLLFLNSRSGTADKKRGEDIRQAAKERGLEVIDVRPGVDISAMIRKAIKSGVRLFIAAGGDGTIHHVVQPLVGTEARLAIIPAGTRNHLAKDLSIPLEWKEALDLALSGEVKSIDVGNVNGLYFTNILVLGLYPDMVRERERLRHWYGKWRAYLRAMYKAIVRFRHVTIRLEIKERSEVVRTPVFAVAVNRYDFDAPGIEAPKVSVQEGLLAVYWLPDASRLDVFKTIIKFVGGRMRLGTDLKTVSTPEITVQSHHRRMRMGMNGELVSINMPMEIKIVPRSLQVVVPTAAAGQSEANPR